jgi:hypothetical protein
MPWRARGMKDETHMTIQWNSLPAKTTDAKLLAALKKIITPAAYAAGQWTLTEIHNATDGRALAALRVIEGVGEDGRRDLGRRLDMRFRMRVLTRQACIRSATGARFWLRAEALETEGDTARGDKCCDHAEPPQPGDVVEWKGERRLADSDGNPMTPAALRRLGRIGERAEEWHEYVVDSDGCIAVPYPYALSMLAKHGRRSSLPRFRKQMIDRKRRITNWWFEEAPPVSAAMEHAGPTTMTGHDSERSNRSRSR